MVWFQCEDCGDNLKKPKLLNHFRSCSATKVLIIQFHTHNQLLFISQVKSMPIFPLIIMLCSFRALIVAKCSVKTQFRTTHSVLQKR
jgi:hypothetical protein